MAEGRGGGGGGPVDAEKSAWTSVPNLEAKEVIPDIVPPYGHSNPYHPSSYNIWTNNCHTQTNLFLMMAQSNGIPAGSISCGGSPETNPGHHTAGWAVNGKDETCIYNYGSSCCWPGTQRPPNVSSGKGLACAKWACGKQYDPKGTRAAAEGKLVESPGSHSCAIKAAGGPLSLPRGVAIEAMVQHIKSGSNKIKTRSIPAYPKGVALDFSPDRVEACLRCCKARGDMWSGNKSASVTANLAGGREKKFRMKCIAACRNSFTKKSK